jgi:hypothetical protein
LGDLNICTGQSRPVSSRVAAGAWCGIDTINDALLPGWKLKDRDKKYLSLTLRHSLRFSTWHSFKNDKISDIKMVDLVMQWLNKCG